MISPHCTVLTTPTTKYILRPNPSFTSPPPNPLPQPLDVSSNLSSNNSTRTRTIHPNLTRHNLTPSQADPLSLLSDSICKPASGWIQIHTCNCYSTASVLSIVSPSGVPTQLAPFHGYHCLIALNLLCCFGCHAFLRTQSPVVDAKMLAYMLMCMREHRRRMSLCRRLFVRICSGYAVQHATIGPNYHTSLQVYNSTITVPHVLHVAVEQLLHIFQAFIFIGRALT